jgi:hypothetical protein
MKDTSDAALSPWEDKSSVMAKTTGFTMNEITKSIVNSMILEENKKLVADKIQAPYNVVTPKEKIKKRPDGYDYVEGTWMDHVTKEYMPFYEYNLLHISWQLGWINIVVSLKDRTTGNMELGAGAARIHVYQGVETPGFKDVIDMGNNIKAALTQAIKNAQSRFGVAADVYGKRESQPTDDERKRFQEMSTQIYQISPSKSKIFEDQWNSLGTDYTEFLERWQIFLDRNAKKADTELVKSIKSELGGKEIKAKSHDNTKKRTLNL